MDKEARLIGLRMIHDAVEVCLQGERKGDPEAHGFIRSLLRVAAALIADGSDLRGRAPLLDAKLRELSELDHEPPTADDVAVAQLFLNDLYDGLVREAGRAQQVIAFVKGLAP